MIEIKHLPVRRGKVPLRIAQGHFATNHSHINYYIDITYQKTRLSEAKDSAYELVSHFINDTPVDTILCLDGTAVLGTCVAEELTKTGFCTINQHQTIYVLEPEYNANSQIIFRDNIKSMISGKTVLITGLINTHVVRTAEMLDITCIVFSRGKQPNEEILEMAEEAGIAVLSTKMTTYTACGELYMRGLPGTKEKTK